MAGWWTVRIESDAQANKGNGLTDYFDELLSDDELLEKSSARLAAKFDAMAGSSAGNE